jgi:hypothetical protein
VQVAPAHPDLVAVVEQPGLRADSSYSMWADRKFLSDGHEISSWAVSESPSIHQ